MATRDERKRSAARHRMSVFRGREAGTNWAAGGVTWTNRGRTHTVKMDLKWNLEALKILQALPLEIAEEVGRQIAAEAQARAAVRTGMLKSGIRMTSTKRGVFVRVRPKGKPIRGTKSKDYKARGVAMARKWRRQVYPVFVEFGTQYMGAQPFLRPAKALVERHLPEIARGKFRAVL